LKSNFGINVMRSVVQISTFYSENGGVEKAVSDLVSGLKVDHDVSVLCTHNNARTQRIDVNGVPVTSVGRIVEIQGRPLAATFPWELGRYNCDVAHYHLPFPLAMASHLISAPKAKLNVATWHHDLVKNPRFKKFIEPLLDSFLDRLDMIIVTAPALVEHTPALYKRKDKCRVIPLGIDEQLFIDDRSGTNGDGTEGVGNPIVLYVGRLVYYKGCDVLIRAMKDVNATLNLVGEGPLRGDLEKLAEDLGISDRVHFLGRVSDQALATAYKKSSLFVLPSTLPTECFGLVQVEAMLSGKPVINTNLPTGVPWVSLHNETGMTVPPNDAKALADAINKLVNDEPLRQKLGQQARERAKNMFTLSRHVSAVSDLYQELLS
jgi:glycosyltransferase involved in cell wall biosynthesis